jgi:hypothetical protein
VVADLAAPTDGLGSAALTCSPGLGKNRSGSRSRQAARSSQACGRRPRLLAAAPGRWWCCGGRCAAAPAPAAPGPRTPTRRARSATASHWPPCTSHNRHSWVMRSAAVRVPPRSAAGCCARSARSPRPAALRLAGRVAGHRRPHGPARAVRCAPAPTPPWMAGQVGVARRQRRRPATLGAAPGSGWPRRINRPLRVLKRDGGGSGVGVIAGPFPLRPDHPRRGRLALLAAVGAASAPGASTR